MHDAEQVEMTTVPKSPSKASSFSHRDASGLRRLELSSFLRSRRERITPAAAGVPTTGRRRTPGLRREEVAQLAGVGVTWYTWLEQGRDIKVSAQVLEAISRTLMLDPDERAHLFTLADVADLTVPADRLEVSQPVLAMLEHLMPFPALVQTNRYDMLAYNPIYGRLIDDLDAKPVEDRNCMWLAFTDPCWRKAIPDWDVVAARMVAQYRALMAEHVAEPAWKAQVRRLRAASPQFAELWDRHEVKALQNKGKRFRNPLVGMLHFEVINTWLQPGTGTRMLTYVPADAETHKRLGALARIIEEEKCA
jgi:transcriptional regulator with XRE-family HTH domain